MFVRVVIIFRIIINCCKFLAIIKIKIVWFMVLSATFNNIVAISWRSVLLVEESGVRGETTNI
jgi:hypothetical protein